MEEHDIKQESDPGAGANASFETMFVEKQILQEETILKIQTNQDSTDIALARFDKLYFELEAEPSDHDRPVSHLAQKPVSPGTYPPESEHLQNGRIGQINSRTGIRGYLHTRLKQTQNISFGPYDVLCGILTIVFCSLDLGSDIDRAVYFLKKGMRVYGGITLGFIVWPSIINTVLGLHWYVIDYKNETKKVKEDDFVTPKYVWLLRFIFTILQLGPAFRSVSILYYGYKIKSKSLSEAEQKRYTNFMLSEIVDSCLLYLFESFLEAAPQLSWQLYVTMVLKDNDDDVFGTLRLTVTLLTSWCCLAISLISYNRALRNYSVEKAKMSRLSVPFYFIWRASEIGGRVLCIALFASTFHLWVFGPLLFHWLYMFTWSRAQKTKFYKNACQERAFNFICGYVMIFCFLNLKPGTTRYRFLLFYLIYYVENFFMLGLWFGFGQDTDAWFNFWGSIAVLIFFVLHITFQLLYYGFFHPTKNIKRLMPCDPYTVYESLCYARESTVRESCSD